MVRIDTALLDRLSEEAARSPRKRANHNLHGGYGEKVQRFLNALHPGTYVRPHRHPREGDLESVILLRGRALVVVFGDRGGVREHLLLERDRGILAVEVDPAGWHTVAALEAGTVLFEVRNGPYVAEKAKEFAPWAPEEGDPAAEAYLTKILEGLGYS